MAKQVRFQDVELEDKLLKVEDLLMKVKSGHKTATDQDKRGLLQDICAALREAKFAFKIALDRYGLNYDDTGNRLIHRTHKAAHWAAVFGFDKLHASILRHAEEIENARTVAVAAGHKMPTTPAESRRNVG